MERLTCLVNNNIHKHNVEISHRCCMQQGDNQTTRYTCARVHSLVICQHTKYKCSCSEFLAQCPLTYHRRHHHHHCCHHVHALMPHHHLTNFQKILFVTTFSFCPEETNCFSVTYVLMAPLLFVSSTVLCFMFLSFFEQSLAFTSIFHHYFPWGWCENTTVHFASSFITGFPIFFFSDNRATSKKKCTGPGLGLSSSVIITCDIQGWRGTCHCIWRKQQNPYWFILRHRVFNVCHFKISTEKIFRETSGFGV